MGVVLKDGKDAEGKSVTTWEMALMDEPETPFPKHWRYYIFIKWAVIVAHSCSP